MDYSKNYARWLEGLTKDQFDDLIKVFIKEFWKVDTVSITDGSGDGGIDVKVFKNNRGKKIPLQITIDKNTIPKLKKDLIKISELIEEYGYSDKFYFYYSKGVSEKKVIEVKEFARTEYDIDLEIFDNKLIGTYIDKPSYSSTREKLKEILNLYPKSEESYFDNNKKLYFDYLTYADESKELKEKFISSFILNTLYISNGSGFCIDELKEKVKEEFDVTGSGLYFDRIIQNLLTIKKIIKKGENLIIEEEEYKKIKTIKENSDLLENEFTSRLQEIINEVEQPIEIRKVIEKLKTIYENQKQLSVNEISENLNDYDDDSVKDFFNYVKKVFNDETEAKKFITKVLDLCTINNFIQISAAGKIYKKLINNPEFSAYTNRVNKEIFIDTPVLIYLLLVLKEPKYEYDNYYFKIAKKLFNLINSEINYGNYNTTQLYINELADYIKKAIKLIPLEKSGIFKSLGGTNNEIHNFYTALKYDGLFDGSFQKFIESFGISIFESEKPNDYLSQALFNIFKLNNVSIDDVEPFDKMNQNKNEFEKIEKQFIDTYSDLNIKNRNQRSLRYDSLVMQHISTNFEANEDPTILTWDKTFKPFRKAYLTKNLNSNYWHIFTPGNFIDHISLLRFKINGDSISNEILSMIETDFEVVKKVGKLADIITSIVDLKSEVGINLSTGLSRIRKEHIYQINTTDKERDTAESKAQPIDEIIDNLINYYSKKKGQYDFKDFTESLKNEESIEPLLKILERESNYYIRNSVYNQDYEKDFDEIIKKTKHK